MGHADEPRWVTCCTGSGQRCVPRFRPRSAPLGMALPEFVCLRILSRGLDRRVRSWPGGKCHTTGHEHGPAQAARPRRRRPARIGVFRPLPTGVADQPGPRHAESAPKPSYTPPMPVSSPRLTEAQQREFNRMLEKLGSD